MIEPRATYRVQLTEQFGFSDVEGHIDHLARLGISHLYTSPVLTAIRGSTHFYDGVDPTRVSDALGGRDRLTHLVGELRRREMGWLADLVPNHLSVADPRQNRWWWETLRDGPTSEAARVFDIDWEAGDGRVILPVLSDPLAALVAADRVEIVDHAGDRAVAVDGFVAPLRADGGPYDDLEAELADQHHRLVPWREGGRNYRVFFAVNSLAGVRVEDRRVFDVLHEEVDRWVRDDLVDGVRIDHIDGLAAPEQYLTRLRERLGEHRWLLVEKILLGRETLPDTWPVDGTTGYELAADIVRWLVDPTGEAPLTELYESFTGDRRTYHEVEAEAKAEVVVGRLAPSLDRVVRRSSLAPEVIAAAAVSFDAYRTYLPASDADDRRRLVAAFDRARSRRPDLADGLDRLGSMVEQPNGPDEVDVQRRFQQLTAPTMAKGAEDTAFYRYHRLIALNEVGSDPSLFSVSTDHLHEAARARQVAHPRAMLSTSTHDTKRSEDVRARLCVLSEIPDRWATAVRRWSDTVRRGGRAAGFDRCAEYLLWQTAVGAWPISAERLLAYMTKAVREAGTETSWIDVDEGYEAALRSFVDAVFDDGDLTGDITRFVADELVVPGRSNSLSQVLLRCVSPGVPDLYQGCEVWDLSLVDPDNRRPIDWVALSAASARLGTASAAASWDHPDDGLAKLVLIAAALQLRKRRPECFDVRGDHGPVSVEGAQADAALSFTRGGTVLALAPRFPVRIARAGWRDTSVDLPPGVWRDVLDPERERSGRVRLDDLLASFPVGLLERR